MRFMGQRKTQLEEKLGDQAVFPVLLQPCSPVLMAELWSVPYSPGNRRAWIVTEDFSFQRAGTVLLKDLPSRSQEIPYPFPSLVPKGKQRFVVIKDTKLCVENPKQIHNT